MTANPSQAEQLARAIIPDLRGLPLYVIVPRAGTLVTAEMLGRARGAFYSGLSDVLRPDLESAGKWQGPGPAIVTDDADDVGLVLHELGHWLDVPLPSEPLDYPAFMAANERMHAELEAPAPVPPALWSHGDRFHRICCHLWYRASRMIGHPVRIAELCFGSDYRGLESLSAPGHYVQSLWDELQTRRGWAIRDVLALPAPDEFNQLWSADLARMFADAQSRAA